MSIKTIANIAVIGLVLSSSACAPKLIMNTSVRDTKDNRAVVSFIEQYRNAMVARSVPDIMALVSTDYLETNGSSDASDDYNYAQLQDKLEKTYAHVKEITLRIHIQNIIRRDNQFDVFYFFSQHSLVDMPTGEQWITATDVNRLVLKMEGKNVSDGFKIISGL